MRPEDYTPRLAFIRYLYNVAAEQSRQPLPMGAAAILGFQDSVELFLVLAAEHLKANVDLKASFDKLYTSVNDALKARSPDQLSGMAGLTKLNQARVNVKHYGNMPNPDDIPLHRSRVKDFFEDNTPLIFDGTDFTSVSLVSLIVDVDVRSRLEEADVLIQQSDTKAAMEKVAWAFDDLVGNRRYRTIMSNSPSIESKLWDLHSRPKALTGAKHDRDLQEFSRNVERSLDALNGVVRVFALGLDYHQHAKFQELTPYVWRSAAGTTNFARRSDKVPSVDDVRFCFDFVVDSAIRLQQITFSPIAQTEP